MSNKFTESKLEQAIIDLFSGDQKYEYIHGNDIHKEKKDVVLKDDFFKYFKQKYANDNLTGLELESLLNILLSYLNQGDYDANKSILKLIMDGYTLRRIDHNKPSIYI